MFQPFFLASRGRQLSFLFGGAAMLLGAFTAFGDWQLVWSDEFNGATIDTNHWKFETGNHHGWGNRELEYYTGRSENAFVADGVLHIVARHEFTNGLAFTSARLKSAGLFSQKYGRFEFRAKVPEGKGYWPALWLMPEHSPYGRWPACGEIDVMENRGNYPAVVQGTIHYADSQGGHLQSTAIFTFPSGQGADHFHTYLLEWTTNSISWSVDGQLYETRTNWSTAKAPYPAPFDQPFYIILNLAVGGNFGGNPDANTIFPGEMQVDYIRVYKHTLE
jgi:beta-glucanase (GH16 family)